MIMKNWHRALRTLPLCVLLLAQGTPAATDPGAPDKSTSLEEANTLVLDAEVALQRGQCGKAALNYSVLAQRLTDTGIAARATQVALDCVQPQLARLGLQRWLKLAPNSADALHAGIRAQLLAWDIDAARQLWLRWLALPEAAKADDVAAFVATLVGECDNVPLRLMFAAPAATANPVMRSMPVRLELAQLAYDGYGYQAALEQSRVVAAAEASTVQQRGEAQWLAARAAAGLGDADTALAMTQALGTPQAEQGTLARTEVLARLGRDQELQTLLTQMSKGDQPVLRREAQRQLALRALASGQRDQAQQLLEPMLRDENSVATGVYYLSLLAEQRDDTQAALRGYGLLGGTAYDASARQRMARLLCSGGQREQALKLFAPSEEAAADVRARLQAHIQRSALLADCGAPAEAVDEIKSQLAEYGADSALRYQYAVVLERAGRTREAVDVLEKLLRARPGDPEVANALGYTLADHSQQLPRAEQLIRSALQAEPDNPSIIDSLAWLQYRRGQGRAALPLFERAWRLLQNGDIAAHWGEVLWNLGEKAQALDVWQRGARLDPDSDLLKKLLQQHPLQPGTEI